MSYYHTVMRFLVQITEPLLGPLRRRIPPLGMFDLSPMAALILLWIIEETLKMLIVSLF